MNTQLIYQDQTGSYFFDTTAHAYVEKVLDNMNLHVKFYGCIYDANKNEAAATVSIIEEGQNAYVIGINKKFTEDQKVGDGLLALTHECGHIFMMEKHPQIDKFLEKIEKYYQWAHNIRENLAFKIGANYAQGILPE
jgi:hypothetical protein